MQQIGAASLWLKDIMLKDNDYDMVSAQQDPVRVMHVCLLLLLNIAIVQMHRCNSLLLDSPHAPQARWSPSRC